MTTEYQPIPFRTWKRYNLDLCEDVPCRWCNGTGKIEAGDCECDECGHKHWRCEDECGPCGGKGYNEGGLAEYEVQVAADRERWQAARRSTNNA